jgi:hypothetical protein
MQRMRTLLRTFGLASFFGLAALALPLPAHAGGMHVDIGLSLPLPFPVVVAPLPAVVYPAPAVVGTGYYGYERYPRGYWRHPHHAHNDYGGYRQGGWRREHSVILTFPVIAVDSAQTPDRVCRYIWHSAALTCDCCSPHTTRHRSA